MIPPRLLERILLVAAIAIALGLWSHAQRKAGAAALELRLLQRENRALTAAANGERVRYVYDSGRVVAAVKRSSAIAARIDTQYLELGIAVPAPAVRELIASHDTTVRACYALVSSCAAALRADSLLIRNQASTIRALERSRPGMVRRWGGRVVWALGGYLVGKAAR